MRFRGPGGEVLGAFGNTRWGPGLSQQGYGHRGDAPARLRKGGAGICWEMPVLPQVQPVDVNFKPTGVTSEIRCLATGHMATVNRCRLKFLGAVPQHALQLKHLPRTVFR